MTSRALITDGKYILLIHRFKDGREYYVLPGGHIEAGESSEQTVIREVKEETNMEIEIDKKLWTLYNQFDRSYHDFFLVTKFSGNLELGGEEREKDSPKDRYILEWHPLEDIKTLNLVPQQLKPIIETMIKNDKKIW
ncbi:MAG: NUDIX domain-containing protein [Candidatus Woesearchaeota archaeon]